MVLPSQQYYAATITIKSDPVAVYSKLNQPPLLELLHPNEIIAKDDSIKITFSEEFSTIHYNYISSNPTKSFIGGFNLEKEDQGTKVTWFFMKDSLSFPLNRWKGFFGARILEEKMKDQIDNLEDFISK